MFSRMLQDMKKMQFMMMPSMSMSEAVDMSDYEKYNRLLEQAQTPVYDDCPVSVLSVIMSQMHLKVKHRTSNGHYGDYSKFIKTLLPLVNRLPNSHYKTKKILGDLGLDYVKIHACKNNCVLFYRDCKEYNFLTLLISGPYSLRKCLDMYLRLLIDELKGLWENGIPTFDRHNKTSFRMRAVVM